MAYSKGIFFLENNTYIKQSEFSLCQCYFQFWVIPISGFPARKRLEETKSAKECKEEKQNADTPKKREKKRHRETRTHTHTHTQENLVPKGTFGGIRLSYGGRAN